MTNTPFPFLQAVNAPVVVMDLDARIIWLNEAGETLFGFATEELKGSFLWENLIAPDHANTARRHYTSIPARQCTLNMLTKSGDETLMKWKNQWVSDPCEETGYVVMSVANDNPPVDMLRDDTPNFPAAEKRTLR